MLTPPPLDANGNVLPHDHEQIENSDGIIRRVSEVQTYEKNGIRRLSSVVFKASTTGDNPGMSIDLEALAIAAGVDPKKHVTTPRWVGSIRFLAGELRQEGFQVGYEPLEEDPPHPANPFHGEVWGDFSKPKQRALRALAEWYVAIPGVEIAEA